MDHVIVHMSLEWQRQYPGQARNLVRVAVAMDANLHADMSCARLAPIAAERDIAARGSIQGCGMLTGKLRQSVG